MNDLFRIKARYERKKYKTGEDPDACFYSDHSLRVDAIGEHPKATEVLLQINLQGSEPYRISIPDEFSRLGYFIIMGSDLPVEIMYNDEVMISVVEKNGDKILAHIPLTYHTVNS
jgi:hypothetical protein